MLRLIGLSSTINVRKPPDNDEEKESLDLCRVKLSLHAALGWHFDIGLHGGVMGGAGEADMKYDEADEISEDLSAE